LKEISLTKQRELMIRSEIISLVLELPTICTKSNGEKQEVLETTTGYYAIYHLVAFHKFS
jgi:hypothetical protein